MIHTYKDIPIQYDVYGRGGDVVVLLHGFLENSFMWKDIVPEVSKKNIVITLDLLGHGETGCLGYVHTMEMMAEAVNTVLVHLKVVDQVTLIGHSMGGYVALAYKELFSDKVNGLCLMNSTPIEDSKEKKLNRDRAIDAVKNNHQTFIGMSVTNLFAGHNRKNLKDQIDEVKREALKTPLQGIIAALEGMKIRKNREHILHDNHYKKMMIIGRKDPVLDYEKLVKQISEIDVELVVFSDGHMSHIENKEDLTYKLLQFIEK